MDLEKLIDRLRSHRGALFEMLYKQDMDDAATALSTLQGENEKLRAELDQVKAERDIAVEYLRGQCRYCKHNLVCTSRKGPHSNCWEWRGRKEE